MELPPQMLAGPDEVLAGFAAASVLAASATLRRQTR